MVCMACLGSLPSYYWQIASNRRKSTYCAGRLTTARQRKSAFAQQIICIAFRAAIWADSKSRKRTSVCYQALTIDIGVRQRSRCFNARTLARTSSISKRRRVRHVPHIPGVRRCSSRPGTGADDVLCIWPGGIRCRVQFPDGPTLRPAVSPSTAIGSLRRDHAKPARPPSIDSSLWTRALALTPGGQDRPIRMRCAWRRSSGAPYAGWPKNSPYYFISFI
ncbi:hypothetical protein DFLDMN_006175 (plasmid) [Cupriavidus sp. H19C3]